MPNISILTLKNCSLAVQVISCRKTIWPLVPFSLLIKNITVDVDNFLLLHFESTNVKQGMDDKVVPPSMSDFVQRVLPDAMVHKLLHEGHFTYLYFCGECHRQIFSTVYGTPQGPVNPEVDQIAIKEDAEDINTERSRRSTSW